MKIAVIGTGIVGRTLAARLAQLGHEVTIGTRHVEKTKASLENDAYGNPPFSIWHKENENIQLTTFGEAVEQSEGMVINCASGQFSLAILESIGTQNLKGKTLIDIANPLDFSQGMPPSLNPVNTDSLGEQIQARFPETKVVKTLNTMNTFIMVDPSRIKGDHSVFVSGNDGHAKEEAKGLLESFGWQKKNIIDLGDISTSRGTEMMLPVWLRLYGALGTPEFNFHIQR